MLPHVLVLVLRVLRLRQAPGGTGQARRAPGQGNASDAQRGGQRTQRAEVQPHGQRGAWRAGGRLIRRRPLLLCGRTRLRTSEERQQGEQADCTVTQQVTSCQLVQCTV